MTFWGLVLGLPLLAYGGVLLCSPALARRFNAWFETSRGVAVALTVAAWLWTARELDTIGIDVFDAVLLKEKTGGLFVWCLAAVLAYLTVVWMPKNLSVRALTALLMLFPASLFRTTRLLVPASGVAPVHLFVVFAYVAAVVGMYGMFYPWRLEKGLEKCLSCELRVFESKAWGRGLVARAFGVVLALVGLALILTGFAIGSPST